RQAVQHRGAERRSVSCAGGQVVGELVDRGGRVQRPDPTLVVRGDEDGGRGRVVVSGERAPPLLHGGRLHIGHACLTASVGQCVVERPDLVPVAELRLGVILLL